jgi:EAL domain-containing protein (putative c-di-GMP-specific phosphodiesterase class I)
VVSGEAVTRIDRLSAGRRTDVDEVIESRLVTAVYQPIIDLGTGETAGFEALARGPADGPLARPEALLESAREVGRLGELDWVCRAAACRGALEAGLPDRTPLFINVEPASSRVQCPGDLQGVISRAAARLDLVAEITERSVASDPAGLLAAIQRMRETSHRIALDDVGADPSSQAMMPLLFPDVIKLDRTVVHNPYDRDAQAVIEAAAAEADRTGARIVAEGIETQAHLRTARAIGAAYGQGWLLGRPAPLPRTRSAPHGMLPRRVAPALVADTPYEIVTNVRPARPTNRSALVAMSRELEDRGVHAAEPTVLLTCFQHVRHFDAATRSRYAGLGASSVLTVAYAQDMPPSDLPRIRSCALAADDPLVGEWIVIVIGSRFAGGLFARERRRGVGKRGVFDHVVSDDRDLVLSAAIPLLRRLAPPAEIHRPVASG